MPKCTLFCRSKAWTTNRTAKGGSMYNLDALASSTPKAAVHPPSWHPKPELFYSAYEPAPITINRATVENKIVIHDHSANSKAQVWSLILWPLLVSDSSNTVGILL